MSKCEYCGALIAPGEKFCSSCGAPVPGEKVSDSVKTFERMLIEAGGGDKISYLRRSPFAEASVPGKIGWILLWILFFPIMVLVFIVSRHRISPKQLSESDNKRVNIISNYTFANDRDTLLEALIFIQNQIDILCDMKKDGYTAFWLNLWTSKAEQTYEKSKAAFGNDAKIEEIFQKIKKQSGQHITKTNGLFVTKIIAATAAMIIAVYAVLQPYIYIYRAVTNTEIIPGRLSHMNQRNEIQASNIMLSGLLDTCFEVGDKNAILEFKDENKYLDVTFNLVCKKNLEDEVNKKLIDNIPDLDPYDPLSGVFYLNGALADYMGKYDIGAIKAQDVFESMLKAQPGDAVEVHLLHEVKTYDETSDFKKVMEVSNLMFSISLTYKQDLGNGELEFPTIK